MPSASLPSSSKPMPPCGSERWRFARLLTAPHRLGFFSAAAVMAASAAWWALALAAWSHARVALQGETASLGLAPQHALTIGYLGATLIAMIMRVAAGHSGRALAADNLALVLYLAVHAAAALRVAASLWPAAANTLTLAAVAAWALGCIGWALRYGNWLGRPRADGRAG